MYPQVIFPVSPLLKHLQSFIGDKVSNSCSTTHQSSQPSIPIPSSNQPTQSSFHLTSSPNSNRSSMTLSNSSHSVNLTSGHSSDGTVFSPSRFIVATLFLLALLMFSFKVYGQGTLSNLQTLKVNHMITTVITANEPIEIVDMSTDNIIGEKTLDNTLMIKPVNNEFKDGEFIAALTIITERYRVQYALVYTEDVKQAVSDKQLFAQELTSFKNPDIKMSKEEMRQYATRIFMSGARIRNISSTQHKMKIRLNNLYSIGGYFFLDFSVENKTNIPFDVDEIRLKLTDKKVAKATNNQIVELRPEMVLVQEKQLKKNYRNVLVIPKMTFPNDKVLTLEMSEQQISGRTLKLNIDYEDILSADAFSK